MHLAGCAAVAAALAFGDMLALAAVGMTGGAWVAVANMNRWRQPTSGKQTGRGEMKSPTINARATECLKTLEKTQTYLRKLWTFPLSGV